MTIKLKIIMVINNQKNKLNKIIRKKNKEASPGYIKTIA
jgi:hypothetical protein